MSSRDLRVERERQSAEVAGVMRISSGYHIAVEWFCRRLDIQNAQSKFANPFKPPHRIPEISRHLETSDV